MDDVLLVLVLLATRFEATIFASNSLDPAAINNLFAIDVRFFGDIETLML